MNKPSAFITGIAGFAGTYLARELLEQGYEVSGTIHKSDPKENIDRLKKKCRLVSLDLSNKNRIEKVIGNLKTDYLFHLAAFSSVGRSFENEELVYKINFTGTHHVLNAARNIKSLKKLVLIGSSECYGRIKPKNKQLTESDPLNPISPYAIAKTASEHLAKLYHDRYDLPVCISRSFNHTGPGQNELFVISAFAKQIAKIEKKKQKPLIMVGNPKIKRDISDVRDIVRGYRLMAEKGKAGRVYQLCSGKAVSIGWILKQMTALSSTEIKIKTDPKFIRKNDIPTVWGDNSRAVKELGFKMNYNIKQTFTDTIEYWRNNI